MPQSRPETGRRIIEAKIPRSAGGQEDKCHKDQRDPFDELIVFHNDGFE